MKADETSIFILFKYADFIDVFSKDITAEPLEYIRINDYIIKLMDEYQLLYMPIFNLRLEELETIKSYIKTNLANGFIRSLRSPIYVSILFIKKLDDSFWLCINYHGLNNLTMKNWYLYYELVSS